jgi:Ca2+-binding EF-hand superfamily protein
MRKLTLAAALIGLATAAAAQTPPAAAPADGASFETWAAHARERLMALDTDHDGKISKDEFAARSAMGGGHWGHRGNAGGGGQAQPRAHDGARMFDRFDTNHDGFIDGQELNAVLAQRFARMDANHDGVLTPDERHAMRGGNAPEQ